jgi:hypothetical protein
MVVTVFGRGCHDGATLDVELPAEPGAPVLTRSFAACLAAAIEVPVARAAHPCVLRGVIHRGGLRADVLVAGLIRQLAVIETID